MLTDILSSETESDLEVRVLEEIDGGQVRVGAFSKFVSALWADSV